MSLCKARKLYPSFHIRKDKTLIIPRHDSLGVNIHTNRLGGVFCSVKGPPIITRVRLSNLYIRLLNGKDSIDYITRVRLRKVLVNDSNKFIMAPRIVYFSVKQTYRPCNKHYNQPELSLVPNKKIVTIVLTGIDKTRISILSCNKLVLSYTKQPRLIEKILHIRCKTISHYLPKSIL